MRVSEVYASTQGEGPNVGKATIFLRFGGCNLRCPGWPCDTQHAIDPAYRNEWKKFEPDEIAVEAMSLARLTGAKWITLTGGEPFIQKESELEGLVRIFRENGFRVECFSNGTILYPDWAVEDINFIMDWKLPGSGEDPLNTNRFQNIKALDEASIWHAVKFVIKDRRDLEAAHGLWAQMLRGKPIEVYYGKVWDGHLDDRELVEYVLSNALPWRLNVQMHNYIWPANERGR